MVINVESLYHVGTISIGKQGESNAVQVRLNLSEMISEYGNGTAAIVVQRPGDTEPYVVQGIVQSGNTATWTVSSADTAKAGTGYAELRWIVNGKLAKSVLFPVEIETGLIGSAESPGSVVYMTNEDCVAEWLDDHPGIMVQDGSITTAKLAESVSSRINPPKIEIYTPQYCGNCTFVHVEGYGWGLIDLGYTAKATAINTFRKGKSIYSLKFLVITHYHNDHTSSSGYSGDTSLMFKSLKAMVNDSEHPLSLSGCKVVLPHQTLVWSSFGNNPVNSGGNTYQYLEAQETELKSYLSQKGCTFVTATAEDTALNLCNNVDLHFFNVDGHGYSYYLTPSQYINSYGAPGTYISYNNYSMISVLTVGDFTAVFPGDVEEPSQARNLGALKYGCDFYLMNHHGVNTTDNTAWFNALNPKICAVGQYAYDYDFFSIGNKHGLSRLISVGTAVLASQDGIAGVIIDGIKCSHVTGDGYADPVQIPTSEIGRTGMPLISSLVPSAWLTDGKVDLNKIRSPGSYYSLTQQITANIANMPTSAGDDTYPQLDVSVTCGGWSVKQTLSLGWTTGQKSWTRNLQHVYNHQTSTYSWNIGDWVEDSFEYSANSSVKEFVLGPARISCGNTGSVYIAEGETSATKTVEFPTAFSEAPIVQLTPYTQTQNFGKVPLTMVSDISTSSFTVRVFRASSDTIQSIQPPVYWFAIGKA